MLVTVSEMKTVVLISLFLYCCGFEGVLGEEDKYTYFYEEIGCTKKGTGAGYDCRDFNPKNGSCRLQNTIVKTGQRVDENLLKGSCIILCECDPDGTLYCPGSDCALTDEPGCHPRYSLDKCCPDDQLICGNNFARCNVEGTTYKEGEKFFAKNSCLECVCDKNFQLRAPFCKPRKCNIEARNPYDLTDYTAAVYFKDDICCPSIFIEDENAKIVKINKQIQSEVGNFCQFGKRKVPLGYGFQKVLEYDGENKNISCECSSPPFLICKEV